MRVWNILLRYVVDQVRLNIVPPGIVLLACSIVSPAMLRAGSCSEAATTNGGGQEKNQRPACRAIHDSDRSLLRPPFYRFAVDIENRFTGFTVYGCRYVNPLIRGKAGLVSQGVMVKDECSELAGWVSRR